VSTVNFKSPGTLEDPATLGLPMRTEHEVYPAGVRRISLSCHYAGRTFWLRQNKFSGSYRALICCNLA